MTCRDAAMLQAGLNIMPSGAPEHSQKYSTEFGLATSMGSFCEQVRRLCR